jgi:AcrR family transcriptional regulator
MRSEGLKKMTQPKVAAAAGIRQSHLTYYFPKRVDLIVALLADHLDHAADGHGVVENIGAGLDLIASDRRRIGFFLNLIVEAEQEPTLRRMVYEHVAAFDDLVARAFGRRPGDPDIGTFVDSLRGFGMKQLLRDSPEAIDIEALARRFGLVQVRRVAEIE